MNHGRGATRARRRSLYTAVVIVGVVGCAPSGAQSPSRARVAPVRSSAVEASAVGASAARAEVRWPPDPVEAARLHDLGMRHQSRGEYSKAESLFLRARDIRLRVLGAAHPMVARSLGDLANLYMSQGAYAKAEPLLLRARAILEQAFGRASPRLATCLNSLAMVYQGLGAYAKAEPLYRRALDLWRKAGPLPPYAAATLSNLALLYQDQGAYAEAETIYRRALAVGEKGLGPTHPYVATILDNLAFLQNIQGDLADAESLYRRALAIQEKSLPPTHPDIARTLNNLASLYDLRGMDEKVEPLLTRARAIREKALPPTHPEIAQSLTNLGWMHHDRGAHARAEALHRRALAIQEKALGPMHPDVAQSLTNLGWLYWAHDRRGRALPLLARAADIREAQLRLDLGPLSEARQRALLRRLQAETDTVVSLQAHAMPSSGRALDLALTTVLRRKGRLLDSLVQQEAALRAHLTRPLRARLERLEEARADLAARLYSRVRPPSREEAAAIAAARLRLRELESALSAASAEFRVQAAPVALAAIRAALPPGAALVEYVRYRCFEASQVRNPWREERYVAYIVRPQGPPTWVALGPADSIDAAVDAALAAMRRDVPAESAIRALRRLDRLVLAPVRARLTGVSHLIVAPDGELNRVPFDALVDDGGTFALDRYLVSYVTAGRDLLRFAVRRQPRSPAAIMAGPDYGPAPRRDGHAVGFAPLAGALGEASDLEPYFPTAPWTGRRATKSALKSLIGPAMLHIATHGFYAREAAPASAAPVRGVPRRATRSLARRDPPRGMVVEDGVFARVGPPPIDDDPADALDRAGLALAGANTDAHGIATAREIAGLDWWGTQLVVLSACDTGVGAVRSGEGVYGLRRALVLAGAASQVVSLWSVSDSATHALMRDYYGLLAAGVGRAEALRQAKRRLMRRPGLAHPTYWAAFIPAGDWRPLPAGTIRRRPALTACTESPRSSGPRRRSTTAPSARAACAGRPG